MHDDGGEKTMREPRTPQDGEVQIVVLLGADTFIAWAPAASLDGLMDSFERRAGIKEADRTDQLAHASIRMRIAADLRGPDSERLFTDVLAAGCLWLSMRHWSRSAEMAMGLARQMEERNRAVLTASVADPAPEGMQPDTAWSFMIGDRIHDGRDRLALVAPGEVQLITRD